MSEAGNMQVVGGVLLHQALGAEEEEGRDVATW